MSAKYKESHSSKLTNQMKEEQIQWHGSPLGQEKATGLVEVIIAEYTGIHGGYMRYQLVEVFVLEEVRRLNHGQQLTLKRAPRQAL